MSQEAGGHRVQRIPPTERRGRVHTSSIKVAVYDPDITIDPRLTKLQESDFEVEWFSGTGKGGQHRNKHENSCRLIHIPTGIVQTSQTRSRQNSLNEAKKALLEKLDEMKRTATGSVLSEIRTSQMGSGERGDKIRTIRFQDNIVVNNLNGKKMTTDAYIKGNIDKIWD